MYSRLCDYSRAVAHLDVIGETGLPSELAPFADSDGARHARLRGHARKLADLAVVANLDEIVEFDPAPKNRRAHRRSVDRRIRANFDIVLDHHAAHLRNFDQVAGVLDKAEAVGANHRTVEIVTRLPIVTPSRIETWL